MNWLENILFSLVDQLKVGEFGSYQEGLAVPRVSEALEPALAGCILSSGWRYDKAILAGQSFSEAIGAKYRPYGEIPFEVVVGFLCAPEVRHRFPERRGGQLKSSFERLWNCRTGDNFDFFSFQSEQDLRDFVVDEFAGLGLKQASMFLRDSGWASELAIIDVHVVWYFDKVCGVKLSTNTSNQYREAEKVVSDYAEDRKSVV